MWHLSQGSKLGTEEMLKSVFKMIFPPKCGTVYFAFGTAYLESIYTVLNANTLFLIQNTPPVDAKFTIPITKYTTPHIKIPAECFQDGWFC